MRKYIFTTRKQDLVISVALHLGLIPYTLTLDPYPLLYYNQAYSCLIHFYKRVPIINKTANLFSSICISENDGNSEIRIVSISYLSPIDLGKSQVWVLGRCGIVLKGRRGIVPNGRCGIVLKGRRGIVLKGRGGIVLKGRRGIVLKGRCGVV